MKSREMKRVEALEKRIADLEAELVGVTRAHHSLNVRLVGMFDDVVKELGELRRRVGCAHGPLP